MPVWLSIPGLIVAGGLSLLWAVRTTQPHDEPERLTRVILGAFGLRVLLALALFGISYWKLPVFASWQLGDGFWVFNPDAPMSHSYSISFLNAWKGGTAWPNPEVDVAHFLLLAAFYGAVGPHPLNAILLNCWMGAATGLLAYLLGRRIFTPQAGLLSAVLVSFWPSALLWSAQLSKDPLTWFLIFAVLWLVMHSIHPAPGQRGWAGRALGLWLALAVAVFLLSCIRQYTGVILALCALLMLVPVAIAALLRREVALALRGALLVGIVVGSVGASLACETHRMIWSQNMHRPAVDRTVVSPVIRAFARRVRLTSAQTLQLQRRMETTQLPTDPMALRVIGTAMGKELNYQAADLSVFGTMFRYQMPVWDIARGPVSIDDVVAGLARIVRLTEEQQSLLRTALRQRLSQGRAWGLVSSQEWEGLGLELGAAIGLQEPRLTELVFAVKHQAEIIELVAVPSPAFIPEGSSTSLPGISPHPRHGLAALAERITEFRRGYVNKGGRSLMVAKNNEPSDLSSLLAYLPRAMAIGLFAPFPSQWFDAAGTLGAMRILAAVEMVGFYLLLPALGLGLWRIVRQGSASGILLLSYSLLVAALLSLIVPNLGTLFRLRLQFLLPLLIVASGGWPPAISLRAMRGVQVSGG